MLWYVRAMAWANGPSRLGAWSIFALFCFGFFGSADVLASRCHQLFSDQEIFDYLEANRFQEAAIASREHGNKSWALTIEKQIEEDLKTGEIAKIELNPFYSHRNATRSYLVHFKNGMKAVFKPDRVRFLWFFTRENTYLSSRSSEIGAYLLDRELGLGMVPVTVERTLLGQAGSLQVFVQEQKSHQATPRGDRWLQLFDYLLGSMDRNPKNYLELDGFIIAIDHGMSLRAPRPELVGWPTIRLENLFAFGYVYHSGTKFFDREFLGILEKFDEKNEKYQENWDHLIHVLEPVLGDHVTTEVLNRLALLLKKLQEQN